MRPTSQSGACWTTFDAMNLQHKSKSTYCRDILQERAKRILILHVVKQGLLNAR
jgi:hypothetical protein